VHQKKKKKKPGNIQMFHRCINFSIFYFLKKGNTTEGFKKNEAKCIITAKKQQYQTTHTLSMPIPNRIVHIKQRNLGAPGWLSQLSVCLRLRS